MDKLVAAAKLFGTEGAKELAGNMVSFLETGLPKVYTDVTSKKKIDSEVAYEEYIKKDYLPDGFNAKLDNPYSKRYREQYE